MVVVLVDLNVVDLGEGGPSVSLLGPRSMAASLLACVLLGRTYVLPLPASLQIEKNVPEAEIRVLGAR